MDTEQIEDEALVPTWAKEMVERLAADPGVRLGAMIYVTRGMPSGALNVYDDEATLWTDIAAVLTVYDEHVAVEDRGSWRDRLSAVVGHDDDDA